MATVHFLTPDDILRIHFELVKLFEADGDPITPPGPRDSTLVPSSAGRPHTSLGGVEKYSTVNAKAAALARKGKKRCQDPFPPGNGS
jgi:hypothetical protein